MKMNLTAVKEENEMMERHVEDSLAIIDPIRSSYLSHCSKSLESMSVVDVGSGACFLDYYWPLRAQEEVARAIRLMHASLLLMCSVESRSKYGRRIAVICVKDGSKTPKKYHRAPVGRITNVHC